MQQEPTLDLTRQHLLEIMLHLAKHPVLNSIDELMTLIDTQMPYTAASINLPGLILLFQH